MSALEARSHLIELESERVLALGTQLGDVRSYMEDLDEDLETWRRFYVTAGVIEIATLRAELFGYQVG